MRILITGDAGFIGTHLRGELKRAGHDVAGIDLVRGHDLLDRNEALQTSAHLDDALAASEPDVVVHLAAQVGRLFGEDDLEHTISSNALMTSLVARSISACRSAGAPAPRLCYCSTSEVYGDLGHAVAHEYGGLGGPGGAVPHNLYGLSKRWGEETSAMYVLGDADLGATGGLQVIRPSMPYGPGLPPGRGRAAIVNMLWQAWHRETITVHRDAERSWCWIGDAVRGIRLVLERGRVAATVDEYLFGEGCYNVGRDDAGVSMLRVAEIACEITGWEASEAAIELVDAPARQTRVKRLATDKLRGLGWTPEVELEEGMRRTLDAMIESGQIAARTG